MQAVCSGRDRLFSSPAAAGPTTDRADGLIPLMPTQSLQQSPLREWSEAHQVQVTTWRPWSSWDHICKGPMCQSTKGPIVCACTCAPLIGTWVWQTGMRAGGSHAVHVPQVMWTSCMASGGTVELETVATHSISPQLQHNAPTTSLLLWSPRHQNSSLAEQILTEDPECS